MSKFTVTFSNGFVPLSIKADCMRPGSTGVTFYEGCKIVAIVGMEYVLSVIAEKPAGIMGLALVGLLYLMGLFD